MDKQKAFIPEALSTLRDMTGYSFIFNLRQQVNAINSESSGNASVTDTPPKHIDSITKKEYTLDSPDYLKHFIDTLDTALSGEANVGKEQFEVTRMLDNPYSGLEFFDDSIEEKKMALSLLHYAVTDDNCDAMNDLADFYAPPKGHHKYTKSAYTSTKTALRLLIKASNFGSSEATGKLAKIYDGSHHIKEVEVNQETAQALRELQAAQRSIEALNSGSLQSIKDDQKQIETYNKAKIWYKQTLDSGTGNPLKHEPLHSVSRYYEKAKLHNADTVTSQRLAIQYLKSQTKNRSWLSENHQSNPADRANALFDLGVMHKLGINGLEVNEQEASSLFFSAGNNSLDTRREIEAMNMTDEITPAFEQNTKHAPAKTMTGPRLG